MTLVVILSVAFTENFLNFKRLHGGAYFVDSLPMTTNGKIKRLEARAIAEKMAEQKRHSIVKIG